LGVPTVASNTGHRPLGAVLFPPGDLDAFVEKVHTSLAHKGNEAPQQTEGNGSLRLLQMYQGLEA
jgi:hypothetical protein